MIKVENGSIVRLMLPPGVTFDKGDLVKEDLYNAKGRIPDYRLAQPAIQP